MTVLDPVIHYLLTCGRKRVCLQDVMAGADRPRRPVLRAMDKLAKEGYLQEVSDDPVPPRAGECGPPRRNPTWKIINDLTARPKQSLQKNTLRGRIWRLIRAKHHFTRRDLVISSGASQGTVDEYVLLLEKHGYIKKTGKDGRFTTYMLTSRQVARPTGLERRSS